MCAIVMGTDNILKSCHRTSGSIETSVECSQAKLNKLLRLKLGTSPKSFQRLKRLEYKGGLRIRAQIVRHSHWESRS